MARRRGKKGRRSSFGDRKTAEEAENFLARETLLKSKKAALAKAKGQAEKEPRPPNDAETRSARVDRRHMIAEKDNDEAIIGILKAALMAAIRSGADIAVEAEVQAVDDTEATDEWKNEKWEEATLDLCIRVCRQVIHVAHRDAAWPVMGAVKALDGIMCAHEFEHSQLAKEEYQEALQTENMPRYRAFLAARMLDVKESSKLSGNYLEYDPTHDYAADVVALVNHGN